MSPADIAIITRRVVEVIRRDYILTERNMEITEPITNKDFCYFVLAFVLKELDITADEVRSGSRKGPPVFARQLYLYLCTEFRPKSLIDEMIAETICITRTMATHHPKTVKDIMSVDSDYRLMITTYSGKFAEQLKTAKHGNNR